MSDTLTRMGVYLTVLDKSEFFPVEPPASAFGIATLAKLQKGEVGVPITFTANNLTDIKNKAGLPVSTNDDSDSNNKEWWSFYRAFNYSKPVSVFRVINDTFKNPAGTITKDDSGDITYQTSDVEGSVDASVASIVATGVGSASSAKDETIIIENSDIADIRVDNITFDDSANDIVKGVYKYAGANTDNIKFVVLNTKAITDTVNLTYTTSVRVQLDIVSNAIDTSSIAVGGTGFTDVANFGSFTLYDGTDISTANVITPDTDPTITIDTLGSNGEVATFTASGGDFTTAGDGTYYAVFEYTEPITKYPEYGFVADLYDFDLDADQSILLVYEDDTLVENFLFTGNSSSDDYWKTIESDYGYFKFNNTVLNDTSYQATSFVAEFSFENEGVGVMSDVTYEDYLTTMDYMVDNTLNNYLITDGGIPQLTNNLLSEGQIKTLQQKLISTIAPAIYGFAVLSYPKSIEDTFVGKLNITESDLDNYVSYRTSLGFASDEKGKRGIIVAPSVQRVFDAFNNEYIWIPVSTDVAGGFTRLGGNYQYSPVAGRGSFGFDTLNWKVKSESLEGYLYKNGVNPIIFQNNGYVLKGHKTLYNRNSAFNRANVARTVDIIGVEAKAVAEQFVGEVALPEVRLQASSTFRRFMQVYQDQGKIVEYKVVVDDTNNTTADIDNNTLNIDILIKPTKLYDFVPIRVTVLPQGAVIN
jgi:hypothetical protein